MKKTNKFLIFFLMLILVLPFSYSVTIQQLPVTQSIGLVIETPIFTTIKIDDNNSFYWNVYNLSNGLLLDNDTISCIFRVFDKKNLIYENNDVFNYVLLNDTLFDHIGDYSRFIQCNSSNYGDFSELSFKVGFNELESTVQDAIISSLLVFIFVIFFIVTLVFAFSIDGNDKFTMGAEGNIILEVNSAKYIKLFLYLFSYLFFWMLTWTSWQLAIKFLLSDFISGVLRIIFIIETVFWVPIIFATLIIGLVKHIADAKALDLAKRRLMPR